MMELSHDPSHSVADLQARLQSALGDAYHIERELGGGGMSRLFLANEASLHRQVVIKLLPPEFASEVSATRFRQGGRRSEEHTSELQSRLHLVCRLLLEKKKPVTATSRMPPSALKNTRQSHNIELHALHLDTKPFYDTHSNDPHETCEARTIRAE